MMSLLPRTAALALLLSSPPAARALDRMELLPPGDTCLRITQAQPLWSAFDRAYGKRFRKDRQLQDFIDAFDAKLKRKGEEGHLPLKLRLLIEMHKILRGEIATVYTGSEKDKTAESVYLAASATPEEFDAILKRTAWLQDQSKDGVVRKRETFQGMELINDIQRSGSTNEMSCWMSCVHGTLLFSNKRNWVERNLVRLKNESVREPTNSKLSMRFPVHAMSRKAIANSKGDEQANRKAIWNALGLLNIRQYLLEIEVRDGNLVIDGTLSVDNLRRGLFNLLDMEPDDFLNDRVVPADATSVAYGKIDLAGFWQKLPGILAGIPPKQSAGFMGLITFFEQQSGLQIGPDLLDHAGTRFSLHTEQVNTNQLLLVSLELHNGKAVEESLNRLLASPFARSWAPNLEITDFRGHTFFQLRNSEPNADPPSLCTTDNHLLFGLKGDTVRRAVLQLESDVRPEPSILQQTARKWAPERAFGYGGMDHRRATALIYIKVSDSSFSAGIGFESAPKDEDKEKLGKNEISLNHLASYLNNTYHYIEAVPNGIHHCLIIETEKNQGAL